MSGRKAWVWWAVCGGVVLAATTALALAVPPWLARKADEAASNQLKLNGEAEERAIPRREEAVREKLAAGGFTVTDVDAPRHRRFWMVFATRGDFKFMGTFSHDQEYRVRGQKAQGAGHEIHVSREVNARYESWYYEGPYAAGRAGISYTRPVTGSADGPLPGPVDDAAEFAGVVWEVYRSRPWPQY